MENSWKGLCKLVRIIMTASHLSRLEIISRLAWVQTEADKCLQMFACVQTYVQPACTGPRLYSGRHRFAQVCCSQERSFVSWKQWTPDKAQDTLSGQSPHRTAPLWISSQHPGASLQRGAGRGAETALEIRSSFGAEWSKDSSWETMCDSACRLSILYIRQNWLLCKSITCVCCTSV